jgi:hypothetical protein
VRVVVVCVCVIGEVETRAVPHDTVHESDMGDLTPVLSRSEQPQPLAPLLPEAPDADLDDLGKGSPGGVSVASHASHGSTDSAGGLADSLQQTRLTCLHGEGSA